MKHFSFVYFSMLLHDSEEGCSCFVLQELLTQGSVSSKSKHGASSFFSLTARLQRCTENPFFFSFCKAEGSSTVDWVIKMKSHPHWFILTHCCRTFELRRVSTVPPTGLLSSTKLGQPFEYSCSSMTTSRYSMSGPMLILGFAHLSPLENSLPSLPKVWSALRIS